MPASKAQQRATNKYIAKAYDRINLTVSKGKRDIIQAHAEAHKESVNGFINRAIDQAMTQDTTGTAEAPQEAGAGILTPSTLKAAQETAEAAGEVVNDFINRAIQEAIGRDNTPHLEALGEPVDDLTTTIQPIPPGTLATAAAAAEAAGEFPVDFIVRAIQEAADRDAMSRRMKGGEERGH